MKMTEQKKRVFIFLFWAFIIFCFKEKSFSSPSFQKLVDSTPEGGTLIPPPGVYLGPVLIQKKIIIDGKNQATIHGGGIGTVVTLQTHESKISNLHITQSGESNDQDDACLNVRGNKNRIENLVLDECLMGIDLKQSDQNVITGNKIRSKPLPLGIRGDAIRLWYSMNNEVSHNDIQDSRDMVVWYSSGNYIAYNSAVRGRYSLHFMFSHYNLVEHNRFTDNSVGINIMYTEGIIIRNNYISHASGPTGQAIGLKEASNAVIDNNDLVYCSIGMGSDISPFQPDTKIYIRGNRFYYNGIAILYNSDRSGSTFEGNSFVGNLETISVSGAGSAEKNEWVGNYWDDYQGFDRNKDGFGDTPYEIFAFADRIWMDIPMARFFKNSPLMEALDFLERLAPFSAPTLILRDSSPLFQKPSTTKAYPIPEDYKRGEQHGQ